MCLVFLSMPDASLHGDRAKVAMHLALSLWVNKRIPAAADERHQVAGVASCSDRVLGGQTTVFMVVR